uniref:Uncharacterized protein n=1 Tax=Chromera velia CCMP2878 TaxID=1169474 RepID=A0A0G4FBK6_9ALVE|eukprot:Cvel_16194.t1-p1 / transcript=Cvel_16194.t1 / gene=Cvel_16194 / organism=Chromera_velia_CCMP2878 / gene_product=hypothetical protein / transcript_product=hypothetical protein / location=Cvel_scaffold1236:12950-15113(-) / protein_length=587 / sequence_SO=supercontig / SO=protein_coding / is_pseudo=false
MPWVQDFREFYDAQGQIREDPNGRWEVSWDPLAGPYVDLSYMDAWCCPDSSREDEIRKEWEREALSAPGCPKVQWTWKDADSVEGMDQCILYERGKYCMRCLRLTARSDGRAWGEGDYRGAIPKPPCLAAMGKERPRREGKAEAEGDVLSDKAGQDMVDFLVSGMRQSLHSLQKILEKEGGALPDGLGSVALKTLSCLRTARLLKSMMAARSRARRAHATEEEKEEYKQGLKEEAEEWEEAKMKMARLFAPRGDAVCRSLLQSCQLYYGRPASTPTTVHPRGTEMMMDSHSQADIPDQMNLSSVAEDFEVKLHEKMESVCGEKREVDGRSEGDNQGEGEDGKAEMKIRSDLQKNDLQEPQQEAEVDPNNQRISEDTERAPDVIQTDDKRLNSTGALIESLQRNLQRLRPRKRPSEAPAKENQKQNSSSCRRNSCLDSDSVHKQKKEGCNDFGRGRRRRSSAETTATASDDFPQGDKEVEENVRLQRQPNENEEALMHTAVLNVRPSDDSRAPQSQEKGVRHISSSSFSQTPAHSSTTRVTGKSGGIGRRFFRGETSSERAERHARDLLKRKQKEAEREAKRQTQKQL